MLKKPLTINCELCKKKFNSWKKKKYCSKKCRDKKNYIDFWKRKKEKRLRNRKKLKCAFSDCDNLYLEKGVQKYCSLKCRYLAQYYRRIGTTKQDWKIHLSKQKVRTSILGE